MNIHSRLSVFFFFFWYFIVREILEHRNNGNRYRMGCRGCFGNSFSFLGAMIHILYNFSVESA